MRAKLTRALKRLLVLLPVLFLLAGCAAQGGSAERQTENPSGRTELATEAEHTQKESSESGSAKSKKKQKKSKKSKKSQKSDKRQSEGAASTASETLSEAETSEALSSTAAGNARRKEECFRDAGVGAQYRGGKRDQRGRKLYLSR